MGPGRDRTRDPWICNQTRICSQTRYRLRYAAWSSDKTETDSIQSQVTILKRAFKDEKTVVRKLKSQMNALTEKQEEITKANKASVDISYENLETQIKALTDKQEEIINVNKASVGKLKSQMNALTEQQEEIIKANKAPVDISHENLEIQLKALTEKQTTQEKIIQANKASVAQLSNPPTPPKVHFFADVHTNDLKLSPGSKVVFNYVISQ